MSAPRELHPRPKFLGALVLVVLGVADRRAGCGYRSAYATWDIDGQWNYERGRGLGGFGAAVSRASARWQAQPGGDPVVSQGHSLSGRAK